MILSLYERGIKALYDKQYQQAMDSFVKLIDAYPEEIELADRARNFIKICQAQGATRKPQQPKTAEEMFDMGVMEHNSGDFRKAIDYFRSAIELQPKADYLYYALAASHARTGEMDLCVRALQKAIQLNPESRFLARNDPDFELIRNSKEFSAVVEISRTE